MLGLQTTKPVLYAQASKPDNRAEAKSLAQPGHPELKTIDDALDHYMAFIKTIDKPDLDSIMQEYQLKKRIFKLKSEEVPADLDPQLKSNIEDSVDLFIQSMNDLRSKLFDRDLTKNLKKRNEALEDQLNRCTDLLIAYENARGFATKHSELGNRIKQSGIQGDSINKALERLKSACLESTKVHKLLVGGFVTSREVFAQIEKTQMAHSAIDHALRLNKNFQNDATLLANKETKIDTVRYQQAINNFNRELELSSDAKPTQEAYKEAEEARKELFNRVRIHNEDLYNIETTKDPSLKLPTRHFNIFTPATSEKRANNTAIISLCA